jgi:hypothetical protein
MICRLPEVCTKGIQLLDQVRSRQTRQNRRAEVAQPIGQMAISAGDPTSQPALRHHVWHCRMIVRKPVRIVGHRVELLCSFSDFWTKC